MNRSHSSKGFKDYQIVPAEVDFFDKTKKFSEHHWMRLGIAYTKPEEHSISPIIPICIELIEVDKERNWKRGDYYHFNWYDKRCNYHGSCELPLNKPMDPQGIPNTDITRLIECQDAIAELLESSEPQIPERLKEIPVIAALMTKTLSE